MDVRKNQTVTVKPDKNVEKYAISKGTVVGFLSTAKCNGGVKYDVPIIFMSTFVINLFSGSST